MSQPLVSIIIPTYNRAHLISETLDSVLAQTYQNWECIVVDDGSTDATEALVQTYIQKDSRFQYHKRPDSHLPGGNGARNYGFEVSQGEFIQWFDDDDVMLPGFIERKMDVFTKDLELVICSGFYVSSSLVKQNSIDLNFQTFLYKDYVLWDVHILTPSVLFRKNFLNDKLLFSDKITRGQETEFFSRLFFKLPAKRFKILHAPLFLYRQHKNTKTAVNKEYISEFKYSQSYIYLENLKRSIKIEDKELITHCLQTLLIHFNNGLKYKDEATTEYIFTNLVPILKNSQFKFYLEFKIIGGLMLLFKASSYQVYKRWKDIKI